MKTPDEIKKGLECCSKSEPCVDCIYDRRDFPMCVRRMEEDALAYIRQLEAAHRTEYCEDADYDCKRLGDARKRIQQLENHISEFTEKVMRLEKERNALLADLRDADMLECVHCAHYIPVGAQCKGEGDCIECDYKNCACNGCYGNSNWKWRGVQEGEYVREF